MEVRPEKGLTYQHFRCECCNQALNTSSVEVRLCDYTGLYYCSDCHHNNLSLIPARILHNWDFHQQTVRKYESREGGGNKKERGV